MPVSDRSLQYLYLAYDKQVASLSQLGIPVQERLFHLQAWLIGFDMTPPASSDSAAAGNIARKGLKIYLLLP